MNYCKNTESDPPCSTPMGHSEQIAQSLKAPSWFLVGSSAGSAMMDSQGPSLSKGLPEQETGASVQDISQNSNGRT